jgi:RHS repeat-associated protein
MVVIFRIDEKLQSVLKVAVIAVITLLVLLWSQPAIADEPEGKSGVTPQVISLPAGPGSLEGLGESFQPNLSTGTASYLVNLLVPPGVNGFQPQLSLQYNGGNPNGPYGVGWRLNLPYIQRQTDKGLPVYDETDRFIYSNAEELIPLGNGIFRFKNESQFIRFQWIGDVQDSEKEHWVAIMPDGTRMFFGNDASSRIEHAKLGIFHWGLDRQIDPNGNEIHYCYKRIDGYPYLAEIRYNVTADGNYNAISFHYTDRPDIFTNRTSRAPISISQRLVEVQMQALGELVRSYRFDYQRESATNKLSLLETITTVSSDGVTTLPPTTFSYTAFRTDLAQTVTITDIPPRLVDGYNADLVDVNYDGLPDILQTRNTDQLYYLNFARDGWKRQNTHLDDIPLLHSGVRMADIDGNGQADLLIKSSDFFYYRAQPGQLWSQRIGFQSSLNLSFSDSNLRLVDVNNDKRIDLLRTGPDRSEVWTLQANQTDGLFNTWHYAQTSPVTIGRSLQFSDPYVQLADMTGDRLQDLIFIRPSDGTLFYAPHIGNGEFEDAVRMEGGLQKIGYIAASQIRLGDINADGLADLLVVQNGSLLFWLNQGDNTFTDMVTIEHTPPHQVGWPIRLTDIDGDGANELLFSQGLNDVAYVDFFTGTQPNLLSRIDNGLGRVFEIEYKPSTEDYLLDRSQRVPWTHTLPFPVQVVSRVRIYDANSQDSYVTEYHYRNGYYDADEKEFRGFAEVIETQHGDESAPTTVTHYFYDVGEQIESRKGLLQAQQITDENGDCTQPESGCYQQITNTLATYEVATGIHFSTITRTHTLLHEATSQPVQLLQSFSYDSFGNQTASFNFGQVCPQPNGGLDTACGNDELLTYTSYAINPDRWIVNAPAVITQTDVAGNVVSLAHLYYDGNPYVGLRLHSVERGNLTRQEESLGPLGNNRFIPTKRQAFDKYGNVIGIKDANDHLTTISYDDLTHTFPVTERIHMDAGRALTYTAAYDIGFGKIISATEFNGNTTRFTYDPFGRIASIVLPGDTLELPTQQFSYNLGSPRSSITTDQREESGTDHVRTSIVYFDGLGRKLQTRSEAEYGQVVVAEAMTFNARQSEHEQFLPYFADSFAYEPPELTLPHTYKAYDPLGRVIRTTNPGDSFATMSFQPLLQIQADEEDNHPGSPHKDTPKTLRYDGLERLVEVVERNHISDTLESYHTHYQYDTLGNLTQITDAQNNIKTMHYDALSRKVFMDDPDRGVMHYVYDDVGNLRQTTDAKGQVITYTYDAANRPLTEQWPVVGVGSQTVFTYHYDADLSLLHPDALNTLGQVTYIEDQEGAVYFSYDNRGNVAGRIRSFSQEGLSFVTRMRYDAMDRLSELTYPDGYTVTYGYNAQGLLETIPGYVANVDYTPAAQRTAVTYTNGVTTRYSYDNRLRLDHLQSSAGENMLQDLGYSFDQTSNIVAITDSRPLRTPANDQTQDYRYDSLYRLTQATGTYGEIDYAYNSIGNMVYQSSTISDTRLNLGAMRHGENGAGPHAMTFAGGGVYGYDDNGNRLGKGNITYLWNARDWLVAVTGGETTSVYAYDSTGQRVRQTVSDGDVITTTLYPDQYAEVRGDQFVRYVFDDQQRIAQSKSTLDPSRLLCCFNEPVTTNLTTTLSVSPTTTLWYIVDHLGGTNLILDTVGKVVSEMAYYPYGLTRYELNQVEPYYQFTGKELDKSGFYYYGARFYDPLLGMFINPDPLYTETLTKKQLHNPQMLNLFTYALNSPLKFIDADGRDVMPFLEVKPYELPSKIQMEKAFNSSNMSLSAGELTVAKISFGVVARYDYNMTENRLSVTIRGISGNAKFGYVDNQLQFGASVSVSTIELCGSMCALVCVSVCGSLGPQLGLNWRAGEVQVGAVWWGAKLKGGIDQNQVKNFMTAVRDISDQLMRATSNQIRSLYGPYGEYLMAD